MKTKIFILYILCLIPQYILSNDKAQVGNLITQLAGIKNFCSDVRINVTLPITMQDISYEARVLTQPSYNDTLSPVKYLIEARDTTDQISFFSYFDGNYYNFSGDKLREYHWTYDSIPFIEKTNGNQIIAPVHRSGLFVGLIPSFLAKEINVLCKSSENKINFVEDSIISGHHSTFLKVYEYIKGNPSRELEYHFDRNTKVPIYYQIISNPGSMSEQTLSATFNPCDADSIEISQKFLMNLHKDIFQKYLTSNFTLNNLKNSKLPLFSLPTTTAERYTWNGEFLNPTIIVFLDSEAGLTGQTILDIRKAVEEMPFVTTVIWIFKDKDLHAILDQMPETKLDEYTLVNGKSLATDCGVTGFPSIIIADKGGIVKNVIIGYNNNLKDDVIQKTVLSINNK